LAEAGLSTASSSSTARILASSIQDPMSSAANEHPEHASLHFITDDDEDDEDRSIPPPPWAPAGTPLARQPPEGTVVLSYQGNASNPPSPLISPIQSPAPLPNRSFAELTVPEPHPPPRHHHQSLFLPQKPPRPRMGPRPITTSYRSSPASEQTQSQSRMRFDPSVAYERRRAGSPTQMFESSTQPSHTSFYKLAFPHSSIDKPVAHLSTSSSVAAHLSPGPTMATDHRPHSYVVIISMSVLRFKYCLCPDHPFSIRNAIPSFDLSMLPQPLPEPPNQPSPSTGPQFHNTLHIWDNNIDINIAHQRI
jgi:hypothetical protein